MRVLLLALFCVPAFAYQCDDFFHDKNKVETINFVATQELKYDSGKDFCDNEDYLDLELTFMPNYFKFQEEDDDHYKFTVHKSYHSCTYIYNISKKFVTDTNCYSTW